MVYASLKMNKRLSQNWTLNIIQYLIINQTPLIFTTFFAGFASICLFFFFLYVFGKYRTNITLNEDYKFDVFNEQIKDDLNDFIKKCKKEKGK